MIISAGIYIHIPVCNYHCDYCDFFRKDIKNQPTGFWDIYKKRLLEELQYKKQWIDPNWKFTSIYFGGGTPSLAPHNFIQETINHITGQLEFSPLPEITLEANPEDINPTALELWYNGGINRLSIGIQSMDQKILHTIGRKNTVEDNRKALDHLAGSKFKNFNIDLIFAIHGQSIKSLATSLESVLNYNPTHLSTYSLGIEQNTPLMDRWINGQIKSVSSRRYAKHREVIDQITRRYNMERYEISNYSQKGYKSVHNTTVWKGRPYIGLGPGSHSCTSAHRFHTRPDLINYLSSTPESCQIITDSEPAREIFIGTMRLASKQSWNFYKRTLSGSTVSKLQNCLKSFEKYHWVTTDKWGFQITREGLEFSDTILTEVALLFD